MSQQPTPEGKRRYPPDGYYRAPDGFFNDPESGPCTCDEHCANPCRGESSCECDGCSLRSVVEHHDGSLYPKDLAD